MTNFKEHRHNYRYIYTAAILFVVLMLTWALVRETTTRGHGAGTLEIQNVAAGARVYVDGALIETVPSGESTIIATLAPGTHEVLINAPDVWPWTKTITTEENETFTLAPFFISQNTSLKLIPETEAEYSIVKKAFREPGPTRATSHDGLVEAYVIDSNIRVTWQGSTSTLPGFFCIDECASDIQILETATSIASLSFFKNRHDVLVLGTPEGIFAVELDTRGTQNFQPILPHTTASFRPRDEQTIFVQYEGDIYLLLL